MTKFFKCILCLIIIGCSRAPENFIVDKVFKDLTNSIKNKSQLEEFKSLPIDSAVINFDRFDDIFQKPLNTLFEDTLYHSQFEESCLKNNLSIWNIADGYVLVAMYHKSLNNMHIDIDTLKKQYYPMYLRKQILKQDNSVSIALDYDCFVKELRIIKTWLQDSIDKVEYSDADIILDASNPGCKQNVVYNELFNETLFAYLEYKPSQIVELLRFGNYSEDALNVILDNLQSPINENIDIDRVVKSIQNLENSEIKDRMLVSLEIAKNKKNQ